jgi:hypothetical protein
MDMAHAPDDRCGARLRRRTPDPEHLPASGGDALTLSPSGRALLGALREDERYRALISEPFGEDAGIG